MSNDSGNAGTPSPEAGTGTAPAPQGTGTAQAPATGTAQATGNTGPNQQAGPDPKVLTKELEAAQARIRELEQAAMTDQERKDTRLAELEAQANTWAMERQRLILRQAAFSAATQAGAVYPDLVVQAISPDQVEWDKDGQPTNLAKVVEDARKAYPALFRVTPGSVDGGAGAGAPAGTSMNDLIRRQIGR